MADDPALEALRDAIESVAAERAAGLVSEARAEAEARVRARLTAAFEAALLDRAAQAIQPGPGAPASSHEPEPEPTTAEQRRPPRSQPDREEVGYYVYGVARDEDADIPDDLEGVDPEHRVTLITHRGLSAFASRVSLAEFGEEPLHENLNDVQWLEEKARAHELVLDHVLARMPVVPMRLCTIYRNEDHVREVLEREHDVFTDALQRLEGKTEWGVKMIAAPGALDRAADDAANGGADEPDLSAGAAYMREKSRAARRRDAADRIAEEWAQEVHDRLAAHAVEALLNPLQNPEVSGHTGDMLLNGVYLVDDTAAGEFHSAVDQLAAEYESRGARVELTGPWPPYNFVKGSIEAAR